MIDWVFRGVHRWSGSASSSQARGLRASTEPPTALRIGREREREFEMRGMNAVFFSQGRGRRDGEFGLVGVE